MKKILFASIFFILTTLICHIANCGYFCRQILIGDDKALLAMASSLITVWGIVVGFSITAIGATIQISKLPIDWKFNLLKDHIGIALWPFFAMILISGVAPFVVLFSIESQGPIVSSPVTGWVTLGFFLQILLIISAISAAKKVYENLSLSKAIHETLKNFDLRKLNGLIKLHKESYLDDYDKRRQLGFLPLSSFTDIIRKKEIQYHDELSTVFTTLFRETIPFNFESGMREVSNWLLKKI
ncbi:MAG: hypothetical protein CO128_05460 [Ignavibacteriales bacterium CG_4_9_14_3_um_filter_30_11]|nr:MAG: hypothetical protein CO128_05460 [Ignavibacteriales bacterium CG_4_9_14_3_um_filter_30_11]